MCVCVFIFWDRILPNKIAILHGHLSIKWNFLHKIPSIIKTKNKKKKIFQTRSSRRRIASLKDDVLLRKLGGEHSTFPRVHVHRVSLTHSTRDPSCVRGLSSSMIIMFGKYVFVVTPEASQPPPSAKLPKAPPSSPLSSLWGWLLRGWLTRGRFFATLFHPCPFRSTYPCVSLRFSTCDEGTRLHRCEREDESFRKV